jgi:excisionase family DNA binding protein
MSAGMPAFAFISPESLGVLPIQPKKMNTTIQPSPLLTREQLATALGICRMTVSRLTKAGRIPFVSVGRRGKRYDREAVVVALSACVNAPAKPTAL